MAEKMKGAVSFETDEDENQSNESREILASQVRELENLKNGVRQSEPQIKKQNVTTFSVPSHKVLLPSQGKVYPPSHPLHNALEVEVRQMTASDEDILTSRSLIRSGKVLDVLLQNCILTPNVDVNSLLPGDRDAIMISLRINSYGSDYVIDVGCPSCGVESTGYEFDLSKLEYKTLDVSPKQNGLFEFKLPSENVVEVRILDNSLETQIDEYVEKIKKMSKSQVDKNVTTRLKHQIFTINGDNNNDTIHQFVDTLSVRDSRALRAFINSIEPIVKMEQDFLCNRCGTTSELSLPITAEFFFPSA